MRMKMIKGKIHFPQVLPVGLYKRLSVLMLASFLTPTMFSTAQAALNITKTINRVDIRITGTITDASTGETLPGVTIKIKGRTTGVATDVNGKYNITAPDDAILVINYLGYQSQEIAVDNRTVINIAIQASVSNLNEVVVTGYGTQQKSDITGAISSVKLKDINETKAVSITEALQGKLAGVNIVTNTGEPGGAITFNIRGMTSVTGSNQPLIVIDGQPIESAFSATYAGQGLDGGADIPPADPLASLNTNDIASIEVLKDASSTAIYGSRGANGVVLITTKSGQGVKDQTSFSSRIDVSRLPKQLDVLNSYEYMLQRNEARANDGMTPQYTSQQLDSISKTLNINWQDEVYRNALSQDYQLSFSGRDKKYSYLLTGNYSDQQSIIKKAGFTKGGLRLNYDREITPKLRVGLKTFLALANRDFGLNSNWTGILGSSTVMGALSFNPLQNPYDSATGEIDETLANNPLVLITKVKDKTDIRTIISNFNADYSFNKDLTYRLAGGINQITSQRSIFYPTGTFIGNSAPGGSATQAGNNNYNYLIQNQLNYKHVFARKHSINAVGAFEYQKWFNNNNSVTNLSFPSNTLGANGLSLAAFPGRTYYGYSERALESIVGRVGYSYDKRYSLTVTGRYDGSTRLSPQNRWQFYPSVGLSWNASNEKFFKDNVKFLSLLKIRTSVGVTGNDNIAVGGSQASYSINYYPVGNNIVPTYVVDNFDNPGLKWETTTKYNAGADFGFLKDKLSISVDYYKHITTDLLINLALPGSAGIGNYFTNVGKIENTGLDIEGTYNLVNGKVNLDLGANFSIFDNKVKSLGDGTIIYGRNFFAGGAVLLGQAVTAAIVGQQISNFYGYKTNGIYQNQAEIDNDPALANSTKAGIQPGMVKYVDVNGDGQISGADQTIIGNPTPDFTAGVNANLSYKSFSATINIFGSYGGELLNLNRWMVGSNHTNAAYNSLQDAYFGAWRGEGTSNLYPRLTTNATRLQQRFPDWMVEDASFIRLQNVTLGYTFMLPQRLKLGNLKAFLTGTNLVTLTKYTGYDPNVSSFGQSSLNNGIDLGTLPQARTLSAGVTLSF